MWHIPLLHNNPLCLIFTKYWQRIILIPTIIGLTLILSVVVVFAAGTISLGSLIYDGAHMVVQHTADSAGTYVFEWCLSPGSCYYPTITFTGPGTDTVPWGGIPVQANTSYSVKARDQNGGSWSNQLSCSLDAELYGCGRNRPVTDSDGDGVPDSSDACPSQGSLGFGIQPNGCPIVNPDPDQDGIPNERDSCSAQGSIGYGVDASGCPIPAPSQLGDRDGDGILDPSDLCPDQGNAAYGIDIYGCPSQVDLAPVPTYLLPTSTPDTPCAQQDGLRMPSVSGISENVDLCEGRVFLYTPESSVPAGDLFVVRVEIDFRRDTTPTPPPLPEGIPTFSLRDSQRVQAYQYVAAELEGLDLNLFSFQPTSNTQVLRLDTENINYWEWELRSNSDVTIGSRYLTVFLYAPIPQEDGTFGQQEIYRNRFRIDVVPNAPASVQLPSPSNALVTATSTPTQVPIDPTFRLIHSNPDSLTIAARRSFDISTLRIRSSIGEIVPTEDFNVLNYLDDQMVLGMCLIYIRYASSPPLPQDCSDQETSLAILDPSDIFWYRRPENALLDMAIYYQGHFLGLCNAQNDACDVNLPGTPQ